MSLQVEVISAASKMFGGQYVLCWTADPDDQAPSGGTSALVRMMTMVPSLVKTVHQNARMRIPVKLTQKWYYVEGQEDKDCEYGKLWFGVASPLANVTSGSSTSVLLRLKWVIEFQMPALPPSSSPDEGIIFASSPNYFSDSSSDWKEGKYLTFKWHEGGNIVGFPNAEPKTVYECSVPVTYYKDNGVSAVTKWAVTATELTEDGMPMLALFESQEKANAYAKSPNDSYLLKYHAAGPWVSPENPPWYKRAVTLQLHLSRTTSIVPPPPTHQGTLRVSDSTAALTHKILKQLVGSKIPIGKLAESLELLSKLSFTPAPGADLLSVFNYDPVRGSSSSPLGEQVA